MVDYKYISADNHIDMLWLPRNLWQDRVAQKYRERAPRVVETDKGSFWQWEGRTQAESEAALYTTTTAADGSSNPKFVKQYFGHVTTFDVPEDSRPPAQPEVMLDHMDRAGVYANVIFGDTRKWRVDDPELLKVVYQAYNDWLIEELSAPAPDRIIALAQLPTALPEVCVEEIERMARKGVKGFDFSVFDAAEPLYEPVWDPVWAAAGEAGLPICCHIGDKSGTPYPLNRRGASKAHFSTAPTNIMKPVAQIIFCGALERNPNLRIVVGECNIGWVPYLVEWMDRQERERPPDTEVTLSMLPSEYVSRQVSFTFEEDSIGARLISEEWSHLRESVMWSTDYPHNHVTWPDPDPLIERLFGDMDPALRRWITFDKARELFNIEVKAPVAA